MSTKQIRKSFFIGVLSNAMNYSHKATINMSNIKLNHAKNIVELDDSEKSFDVIDFGDGLTSLMGDCSTTSFSTEMTLGGIHDSLKDILDAKIKEPDTIFDVEFAVPGFIANLLGYTSDRHRTIRKNQGTNENSWMSLYRKHGRTVAMTKFLDAQREKGYCVEDTELGPVQTELWGAVIGYMQALINRKCYVTFTDANFYSNRMSYDRAGATLRLKNEVMTKLFDSMGRHANGEPTEKQEPESNENKEIPEEDLDPRAFMVG